VHDDRNQHESGRCRLIAKAKLPDLPAIEMFDITWVGLPCAAASVVFVLLFSRWLLPDRRPAISLTDDPRQYTVKCWSSPAVRWWGKASSRRLEASAGLYLREIDRLGSILPAVGRKNVCRPVIGWSSSASSNRWLTCKDARLIPHGPDVQVGRTAPAAQPDRSGGFGSLSPGWQKHPRGAFSLGVQRGGDRRVRSGKRITARIGDIVLQPGDTLLLEAHQEFVGSAAIRMISFWSAASRTLAPRGTSGVAGAGHFGRHGDCCGIRMLDMLTAALLAGC